MNYSVFLFICFPNYLFEVVFQFLLKCNRIFSLASCMLRMLNDYIHFIYGYVLLPIIPLKLLYLHFSNDLEVKLFAVINQPYAVSIACNQYGTPQ